eukprot:scaffold930_cov361-Pavlova_lutheri.AAC.1
MGLHCVRWPSPCRPSRSEDLHFLLVFHLPRVAVPIRVTIHHIQAETPQAARQCSRLKGLWGTRADLSTPPLAD